MLQLQAADRRPDWIHAHYADAGYVGALVSRRLGLPLVFTGHSLGREKLRRLLAAGGDREQIEQTYSISRRIDAEELALAHADLVITSTRQERDHQYSRYGRFEVGRADVIPPGVDARRFHPAARRRNQRMFRPWCESFLREPQRPRFWPSAGLIAARTFRHWLRPTVDPRFCASVTILLVLGIGMTPARWIGSSGSVSADLRSGGSL